MKIKVMNAEISVQRIGNEDYISLTDMARSQMQEHIIFKWLSTKSTIEYLGEWESLYNPDFNYTEFGTIKNMAGSNNFVLSTKQWILSTNALGIVAKTGRYGEHSPIGISPIISECGLAHDFTYFSFTNTSVSRLQNRLDWAGPCGENCRKSTTISIRTQSSKT